MHMLRETAHNDRDRAARREVAVVSGGMDTVPCCLRSKGEMHIVGLQILNAALPCIAEVVDSLQWCSVRLRCSASAEAG